MTTPAITTLGSSKRAWLRKRNPLCSVYMSSSVVMRLGQRYMFHVDRNASAAIAPMVQAGNVYLPELTSGEKPRWVWEYIEELAGFPSATYDDQVDATSQALTYLQPQGWAAASRAAREALKGRGPENPVELRNAAFARATRKVLKRYEKRLLSGLTRRR